MKNQGCSTWLFQCQKRYDQTFRGISINLNANKPMYSKRKSQVSHNITTLPSTLAHFEMTDKCNKTTANNRQGNTQATSVYDMSTSVFRCYSDDDNICLSD